MKSNIFHFTSFAISITQFATVYGKINWNVFSFCWKISMTYYCKTIAILLRNSAILLTYCIIEYCNSAIPQHYCYCFVQYSEKLLTVSLHLSKENWIKGILHVFMQTLRPIELSHESKIIGIFGQTSFQFLCPLAKSLYFLVDSNYSYNYFL